MRRADAACQKRSEPLDFGDRELAREVRVKLVQPDVADRRAKRPERRVELQRRRRSRPAELDQREIIEANTGGETVARGVPQGGLRPRGLVRLDIEGSTEPQAGARRHLAATD